MRANDSRPNRSNILNSKQLVDHIEYLTVGNPDFLTIAILNLALVDLLEGFAKAQASVGKLLSIDVLYQLFRITFIDFSVQNHPFILSICWWCSVLWRG